MLPKRRRFTGNLLKAIDLRDAQPSGLAGALAAPPSKDDRSSYIRTEFLARLTELDRFFGLDSQRRDIWECRAKTLIEHKLGIKLSHAQGWEQVALRLAIAIVPGFSPLSPDAKKHGGQQEWTDERLVQLFADVEYLKRKRGMQTREVWNELRKGAYAKRWKYYRPEALRKAYSQARKCMRGERGVGFLLEFCGGDTFTQDIDPVEAAIERHTLKI